MGFIEDLTKGERESFERLDKAIRAVVAMVLPDNLSAGGGLLGCGLQLLLEAGLDEEQCLELVSRWFATHSDVRARLLRLQLRVVPDQDPITPPAPAHTCINTGTTEPTPCPACLAVYQEIHFDWQACAKSLWQLLDDIDTLGDSMHPEITAYFNRVNAICEKRHRILHSDGDDLKSWPPPPAAPLETPK
jgi:hypothetical protein